MAVLPYARLRGDRVKVYNVRNCSYIDEETYVLNYDDRTYDLDDLETLDFVICPFTTAPSLAHTMLSFGFRDGRFLAVSVEVRLEEGEVYSTLGGAMRQFEIMYVVADERDVIKLRTEVREADVYVYRSRATKEQVRALFVDVLKRSQYTQETPRVLRHVDEQLHDQHRRTHQPRQTRNHSLGSYRTADRLFRPHRILARVAGRLRIV